MSAIRTSTVLALLAVGAAVTACGSTPSRESTGQYVDDATITSKVKAKIAADDSLASAAQIHVDTYKGVVQLSGFTSTRDQEQKAIVLARNVAGVREVQDSISIKQ